MVAQSPVLHPPPSAAQLATATGPATDLRPRQPDSALFYGFLLPLGGSRRPAPAPQPA